MEIPRRYIDNYTKALNKLSADVQKRLAADLAKIDLTGDVATVRDAIIARMEFYCGPYTDMAAILAADFYDGLREQATGAKLGAYAESGREPIATEKAVRGIMQDVVEGKAAEVVVGKLTGRVDYEVKRAAGECIYRNGKRDPLKPKYARVPSGGETCRFCIMLASRGFVYHNAEAAGENGHYHANCDCRIVPGFDGETTVPGYDPDLYYDMWKHPEKYEGKASVEPRQAPQPKVTGIDKSAPVYSTLEAKHVEAIAEIIEGNDSAAASVYTTYENALTLLDGRYKGGAHFSPSKGGVNLNVEETFSDAVEAKMATWFHEFGHQIDYLAMPFDIPKLPRAERYKAYASTSYKDNLFGNTIKAELDAIVDAKHKVFKDEAKTFIESVGDKEIADSAKEWSWNGKISAKTYEDNRRTLRAYSRVLADDFNPEEWGYTEREIADIIKDGKKAVANIRRSYVTTTAKKDEAYKAVAQEARLIPSGARANLSDILEGASGAKIRAGWGHGASYWKDGDAYAGIKNANLAKEAFAEMFDAYTSSPESLKVLKEWLPESCKVFDEIMEAIKNGTIS